MTRPGEPIPALTLATTARGSGAPVEPSRQQLLDDTARAAYLAHGRELVERLAEAEDHRDLNQAATLQAELEALADHVEAATGVAVRPRVFASPAERARTAVRKAIRRAIDHIDAADPALADLLRATVSTGVTCLYTADPSQPIRWSTSAGQH